MHTFTLTISRVHELLYQGDALSVNVPSVDGTLTILAHHEPLITLLAKGTIHVNNAGEGIAFNIENGVCEVGYNHVTLLV
jgi:F-type H+-transporting ATPase subunit epsilon